NLRPGTKNSNTAIVSSFSTNVKGNTLETIILKSSCSNYDCSLTVKGQPKKFVIADCQLLMDKLLETVEITKLARKFTDSLVSDSSST
ncbi:9152_t:CDS:1, partial [Cetraspora pellucida]